MSIIRTRKYIDVIDLPEEAGEVYRRVVSQMGLANGENYFWIVGEPEDDNVAVSYVGVDAVAVVDAALKAAGLEDGEGVYLVFEW